MQNINGLTRYYDSETKLTFNVDKYFINNISEY